MVINAGYERPLSIFMQETWRQGEMVIETPTSPSVKSQNPIFFLVPRESKPEYVFDRNIFCIFRNATFILDVTQGTILTIASIFTRFFELRRRTVPA